MSDNENKKGLFSINIVKKTESASPEKVVERQGTEIGVEADIPIEGECVDESLNISSNLKLNKEPEQIKEESESPAKSEILEKKVQVFNISSGKVIEKGPFTGEKEVKVSDPPAQVNKKFHSAIKEPQENTFNRILLIASGIVILLILLFVALSNSICVDKKTENDITPVINLSK